jgi:hypothetical protein
MFLIRNSFSSRRCLLRMSSMLFTLFSSHSDLFGILPSTFYTFIIGKFITGSTSNEVAGPSRARRDAVRQVRKYTRKFK